MTEAIDGIAPDEDVSLSADQVDAEDQTINEADGDEQPEAQPEPKPKKTAQERINELTRKAREAERDAQYWRDAAMSGHSAKQTPSAPAQPRDAAPSPDDFQFGDADPGYLIALAKHEAVVEIRQEFEARDRHSQLAASRSTFEQRVAEAFPDGEPEGIAALRDMPRIRPEITDVIFTSDKGPLLADHLGENPSVLTRLNGLAPHLVGFELAKIEAALTAPAAPLINRVTKAPDPAPKPRGGSGQFQVAADTNDFAAFERFAAKTRSS